jgi:pimeloyl-ACP methyl ester carboxylesterase
VPALAKQAQVFAVDLAGFGGSRGSGRFQLDQAVPRLLDWLDSIGLERASLVGHSLGGVIAAMAAATAPERIERLVLADPAIFSLDPGLRRHPFGTARAALWMPRDLIPIMLRDAVRAGPLSLGGATVQLLRADEQATLDRIQAPTLVVWGERDTVLPPAVGQRIVERIPDARLVVIPGAGHNVMWDQPEAFNRAVIAFLVGDQSEAPIEAGDRTSRSGDGRDGGDR